MTDAPTARPAFLLPPPATVGMSVADADTPALLMDLDAFEANLSAMTASLAGTGVRLRPHGKSHKCPELAKRQIAAGAVGVCCQKVSEAEAFVHGGVADVLVANEVVGPAKLRRLAALAKRAKVTVCVDHPDAVDALAAAAAAADASVDVLVEVDVGANRCGVPPGPDVVALAKRVSAAGPHLRFAGLQGYQGSAQHARPAADRRSAIERASDALRKSIALLKDAGLAVGVVTGGGTGTYLNEAASGVYTEVQPGSYVFMDADYRRNLDPAGRPFDAFRQSLFVLATVMSRPTATRAVIDVGLKAHSVDSGFPWVADVPGAAYVNVSDEHGVLDLAAGESANESGAPHDGRPSGRDGKSPWTVPPFDAAGTAGNAPGPFGVGLGQKLRLVPGHCDPTVNLYDWLVGYRGDRVEHVWPVAARGAFY